MIKGLFVSRTGMVLVAISALVIIPTALVKFGIENLYTDILANPFASFVVIFIIGAIVMNRYIRGNIVLSGVILAGIAAVAYLYVYTLLL